MKQSRRHLTETVPQAARATKAPGPSPWTPWSQGQNGLLLPQLTNKYTGDDPEAEVLKGMLRPDGTH